jgi:hypothetical protein
MVDEAIRSLVDGIGLDGSSTSRGRAGFSAASDISTAGPG